MRKEEKTRKVYQKFGITVSDKTLKNTLKDKERTKGIIRIYKQEEMDSMNYILGKSEDNRIFTEFELEAMNKIDLFNKNMINVCKYIWTNKENPEKLNKILNELNGGIHDANN